MKYWYCAENYFSVEIYDFLSENVENPVRYALRLYF